MEKKIKWLDEIWAIILEMQKEKMLDPYLETMEKTTYAEDVISSYPNITGSTLYERIYLYKIKDNDVEKIENQITNLKEDWCEYLNLKKEIEEKTYKVVLEQEEKKLRTLFYEMLDYKNKKYDKNMNFLSLLDFTSKHYHYLDYLFKDCYTSIASFGVYDIYKEELIDISEIEVIQNLRYLYSELLDLDSNYKKHAYDYIDVDLKEGETYSLLIDGKEEELESLFQEMLDYKNIPYSKEVSVDSLALKVSEEYKEYQDYIQGAFLQRYSNLANSYIDILDALDRMLKYLADYKTKKHEIKEDNYQYDMLCYEEEYDNEFIEKYEKLYG